MNKTVTIIGAGIAGLTTAIALKQKGIDSVIFEASPEIREVGAGLGLGINAILAFEKLGMKQDIAGLGRMLTSFTIYDKRGKAITQTQNMDESNFTIHRATLQRYLLSQLDPSSIHLGKKVFRFDQNANGVLLHFEDGSKQEAGYVIAADGINSPVRTQLIPHVKPRYSGYTCWRGIVDNSDLQLAETSETWENNGRFGLVPLADNKIYWFACINTSQNNTEVSNYSISDLQRIFAGYHAPIPEVISQTQDRQLIWGDIMDLKPLKRFAFGSILLIGDAAHATTPNMGQGACQAIEDALILAECMVDTESYESAFTAFEKRRKKRTKWITDNSRMIGKVAQWTNPILILKRNLLFRLLPASVIEAPLKRLEKVDF